MLRRLATKVVLSVEKREKPEAGVRAQTSQQHDVRRGRVMLGVAPAKPTIAITARLGHSTSTLCGWPACSAAKGMKGLLELARLGRRADMTAIQRCEIVAVACEAPPQREGVTGSTVAALPDKILQQGIVKNLSLSELGTLLSRMEIKPHKMKMWLQTRDRSVVGEIAEIVTCT